MFKWVMPASALASHTSATTTATATTIATRTTPTAATTATTKRQLLSNALTTLIIIGTLFVQTTSGFRSIETNGVGRKLFGGYRITPKHCRATKTLPSSDPRSNGPTICMFNHECAQRDGEVVGACMDGFLFGACCQIPQTHELASTLINDAQNAYFHQQQQKQQQQKQQQQQQAAAQSSYESYGEQQQQQQQQQHQQLSDDQENLDKVYQQLGSTGHQNELSYPSTSSTAATQSHSESVEFEQESELQTNQEVINSNELKPTEQPPAIHVHKHSVKINTFSSPPNNDDFVMQVLATLPPDHADDVITFTTEVPNKIASGHLEQSSSESSSFEEPPATKAQTQTPTTTPKPRQQPQVKPPVKAQAKPVPQLAEAMKRPVQQLKPKPKPAQHTNMHHHNHLILDGGEFTHSDITHPGADADLVEDLQFSTGYGPQPVYVQPPKEQQPQPPSHSYISSSSNEKRPAMAHPNPTTVSSITTHVDSIESIILQLNNSNHGPSYNVVSQQQQTPSYAYTAQADPTETTVPPSYYSEQNKTPDQQDYGYTTSGSDEPGYDKLSPVHDDSSQTGAELATPQPNYNTEDESSVLDEHTMPSNTYNDANAPNAAHTSDFNKMPVMGIAYPVDMSYIESESGQAENEAAGYDQLSSSSLEANTEVNFEKITNTYTEPPQQPSSTYVRPSTPNRPVASYIGMVTMQHYNDPLPAEVSVSSHTTKVQAEHDETSAGYQHNQKLPSASPDPTPSYLALTTTTQALRPQYDNVPESSSLRPVLITASPKPRPKPTTKKPPSKKPVSHKKPAQNEHANTRRPIQQPSSSSYNTEESPITHIQVKQPGNNYNPAPQQSASSYAQAPVVSYDQPAASSTSYDSPATPTSSYDQSASVSASVYDQPPTPTSNYEQAATPTSSYDHPAVSYDDAAQPAQYGKPATVSYDEPAPAPAPAPAYQQPSPSVHNYNKQSASSPTRKPVSSKPISTSYVTGPTTPRPPATVDYHYDKVPPLFMADDKLDAFIQSTAENILGSTPGNYQPPLFATASAPIHIQQPSTSNYGGHKKPGFAAKPTKSTVLITPKPTTINLPSSSNYDDIKLAATTNSYIYAPTVTRRPPTLVSSNDFEDPGYFGMPAAGVGSSPVHLAFTQSTTEAVYGVPSDDKPAFPGYYGPTPTYPAFSVPGEKVGQHIVEETYTSPNDFNNFPPVRNPNLNMSAASSAVTSDLEMSTPAFVEDIVLKDKMHTLVHKLVASLQGNFEALADMIDDANNTASSYSSGLASTTNVNRKTTRKPVRVASTVKPKATTKRPVTRVSTKAPNKKTSVTTTRKPVVNRRTTVPPRTTTRRPASKKPTKRISSTPKPITRPVSDDLVDEEDEEDFNPSPHENEIDQGSTLSSYGGANGRKIQCGVRPHVKSGRIVGGKGSTFGAFPWQVLVRESTWLGLFTKNKCGGVLITSRYVITAAHCQPGFLASLVAVMGEFDISGDLESKRPTTKNVKRVIVHRQYDPATFENDLALLEMDSPVQFDTHIVPICMPNDQADFTGRMATVTGWGRLKYGGGVPSVLQEVQVPIIENSVCQEMFHTAGHNKKILGSFLCAGYANGQKDSCEGDSGGPLVLQRPDGRYELAGTVSHGIKCAAPYLPGVYMRTTFYKPWLRSITGVK
ncbi:GH20266 [Drosophila grimshawi]|uniref:GH20266 n=1 Tax=Drosophila grimshawi TaxID=7222 RepID=B4J5E1_DROGR|nr:GH20266 [Drosophila grimshawi]